MSNIASLKKQFEKRSSYSLPETPVQFQRRLSVRSLASSDSVPSTPRSYRKVPSVLDTKLSIRSPDGGSGGKYARSNSWIKVTNAQQLESSDTNRLVYNTGETIVDDAPVPRDVSKENYVPKMMINAMEISAAPADDRSELKEDLPDSLPDSNRRQDNNNDIQQEYDEMIAVADLISVILEKKKEEEQQAVAVAAAEVVEEVEEQIVTGQQQMQPITEVEGNGTEGATIALLSNPSEEGAEDNTEELVREGQLHVDQRALEAEDSNEKADKEEEQKEKEGFTAAIINDSTMQHSYDESERSQEEVTQEGREEEEEEEEDAHQDQDSEERKEERGEEKEDDDPSPLHPHLMSATIQKTLQYHSLLPLPAPTLHTVDSHCSLSTIETKSTTTTVMSMTSSAPPAATTSTVLPLPNSHGSYSSYRAAGDDQSRLQLLPLPLAHQLLTRLENLLMMRSITLRKGSLAQGQLANDELYRLAATAAVSSSANNSNMQQPATAVKLSASLGTRDRLYVLVLAQLSSTFVEAYLADIVAFLLEVCYQVKNKKTSKLCSASLRGLSLNYEVCSYCRDVVQLIALCDSYGLQHDSLASLLRSKQLAQQVVAGGYEEGIIAGKATVTAALINLTFQALFHLVAAGQRQQLEMIQAALTKLLHVCLIKKIIVKAAMEDRIHSLRLDVV